MNQIDPATVRVFLTVILGSAIPCAALYFAYLSYARKSGLRLRGSYHTVSTIACEDDFVSRVTIENLKDRAVTIFGIYLKIGHNIYVLIEEFGDQPLLLRPFETYQRDYDPLEFYALNMKRVSIDKILKDRMIPKRLVLSTSDGKYTVRKYVRQWDPVLTVFRNHATAILRPVRSEYSGKAYGSNTAFLVELSFSDEAKQVIPIYVDDYKIRRLGNIRLSQESLESQEALESLLNRERDAGRLGAKSVKVYDVGKMRAERLALYDSTAVEAHPIGWFHYYFGGWVLTKMSNWKMRRTNKKRERQKRISENEGTKKSSSR